MTLFEAIHKAATLDTNDFHDGHIEFQEQS